MKKLMALAAAVMMAVVANAGAVKWQCYDIGDDSTHKYDGALAYLILSEESSLSNTAYSDALSAGTFTGAGVATAVDWTEISVKTGSYVSTTVYGYMILLDTDDLTTYENYKVSDVVSATFGTAGDKALNFTDSIASQSWTAVATSDVPEPTSGLLMLLGVAGLALRRRRA